jgi:hypothetical protein
MLPWAAWWGGIWVLVLGLSLAGGQEAQGKPATPAEQYQALLKEWHSASLGLFSRAKTDEERNKMLGKVDKFPLRFLELAEKYSKDPMALDARVQVVNLEIALENNTSFAGHGKGASPQAGAIALLLRDHLSSDKLDYACWRASYGFHKDCERFLRHRRGVERRHTGLLRHRPQGRDPLQVGRQPRREGHGRRPGEADPRGRGEHEQMSKKTGRAAQHLAVP